MSRAHPRAIILAYAIGDGPELTWHADGAIHTGALILLADRRRHSIKSKPKVVDEGG
jgi:hypothetical protein